MRQMKSNRWNPGHEIVTSVQSWKHLAKADFALHDYVKENDKDFLLLQESQKLIGTRDDG